MKMLTLPLLLSAAVLGLMTTACSKDEAKSGGGAATATGTAAAKPEPKPEPKPDPKPAATDDGADYIRIVTPHVEPKPSDPVVIHIRKFKVVKADFDPAKVEGGTAELELDFASLDSGSAKRDGHLQSPDYLDVGQFAVGTISVANVKKTADNTYGADATVKVRGLEKTLPVTFTVLETTATGIKVQAEHRFPRLDFGIGAPVGEEKSAPEELTIQLRLTLTKA